MLTDKIGKHVNNRRLILMRLPHHVFELIDPAQSLICRVRGELIYGGSEATGYLTVVGNADLILRCLGRLLTSAGRLGGIGKGSHSTHGAKE